MSREILFRAWDTVDRGMLDNIDTVNLQELKAGVLQSSDDIESQFTVIFMQYIGCEDTKCTKLFQGDIVNLKMHGTETHVEWQDAEIMWCDFACAFAFFIHEKTSGHHGWMAISDKMVLGYEKIGDIYNNPELLNG